MRRPYYIRQFHGRIWPSATIMIKSFVNGKHSRNLLVGVSFLLTLIIIVGFTIPLPAHATAQEDPIKILFVMDEDFGSCYDPIRGVFERFGWEITTTALTETLTSCNFAHNYHLDVDIILTEISDVTEYDILTILPGNSHDSLRTNETALDLIHDAVSENLIVTAWCRAVRVLAAADVIQGKNVTGQVDYQSEYEAAGATFFELVPPITDGNIITSVRSTFYREETCNAIAAAVGFYEPNAPTFTNASISPSPSALNIDTILTVNLYDETFVYMVNCKVYQLNETGGRPTSYTYQLGMNNSETINQFDCIIRNLDVGDYTVDLLVWDCFMNYIEFTDVVEFSILEELPSQGPDLMELVASGAVVSGVVIVIGAIVIIVRKR